MARKRKGPSLNGIFKGYFESHPEFMKTRDNSAVVELFRSEHPSLGWNGRTKQAMANAKNYVKKHGKRGRKMQAAKAQKALSAPKVLAGAVTTLDVLEDKIDYCLVMAKQLNDKKLESVIKHLHRARNDLVMIIET